MKAKIINHLKIGNHQIKTTEQLAKLVLLKGRKNICEFLQYMKCISIDTDLQTDTGTIKWIAEDGTLISEKGYHYNINCFI